jgi:hypothetical protein
MDSPHPDPARTEMIYPQFGFSIENILESNIG